MLFTRNEENDVICLAFVAFVTNIVFAMFRLCFTDVLRTLNNQNVASQRFTLSSLKYYQISFCHTAPAETVVHHGAQGTGNTNYFLVCNSSQQQFTFREKFASCPSKSYHQSNICFSFT